jgi:DNA-directed RNA polymerase beta' subunit
MSKNVVGAGVTGLHKALKFRAYKKKAETIKTCPHCHEGLYSFFIERHRIMMYADDKSKAVPVTAREAHAILTKVSFQTMVLLGFNEELSKDYIPPLDIDVNLGNRRHPHEVRPEAFIFTVLPVIPTCARPWVVKGSERKDDDLTDQYNSILKINAKLSQVESESIPNFSKSKKKLGKLSDKDRSNLVEQLQTRIRTLSDNSKEKSKNTSRQHKGLRERLSGKEGHVQNNVGGKRVDYTARSVIVSGGDQLPMGWIGVPEHVASTITIPELVVEWNYEECARLLELGKVNKICRGGFTIDVKQVTDGGLKPFMWGNHQGLMLRDTIHRQLQDGDWGIFNRQPTLRKESMQGIQIKILYGEYVFRLPLGMTRPLNADQDRF